ncbi:hypothetical protein [Endozoicomonas elysicola]|uniref:Spore coat protein U domain-containing protein n=1 Tax=Endozoicomonas elysicola TaxID=305900 RepID=A0A081K7E7_9GAMM|nr:hypothetical protein [Endozoicomonas elysicola]KEI70073.1 hypothetical protein GV64_04325 [Endozoicomonas elysicola]
MKTLKTLALATAVSAGLLGSVGAMAAVDGDLTETTSTGKFDINLNIPGKVAIWGMRDLPFTSAGATSQTINACVFSSTARAQFLLNTTNTDFQLKDNGTKGADYTVTVKESGSSISSTWGTDYLANNQASPINFNVASGTEPNNTGGVIDEVCAVGGDFQKIDVTVTLSNVVSTTGTYTDEVTLVVSAI